MIAISDIRKEYKLQSLTELEAARDPLVQFNTWWQEAIRAQIDEVNAMTLATASADGLPSARIVLLKGFDHQGFSFFTNYNSHKAKDLEENPRACLVFFWKELERQVRVTGLIEKLSERESTEYFNSRPEGSRIGAWASPQSTVIEGREWLEKRERETRERFKQQPLLKPPHWGGYRLNPVTVEFWQGRPSRLHDRLLYALNQNGQWGIERLAP